MTKRYRRYKNSLEMFLASDRGKRTINIFYSWGGALVILGAMFKILHYPYANEMLFVGMMTEFFVFFVSGFEKPENTYNWEEVFPELSSKNPLDKEELEAKRRYQEEHRQAKGDSLRTSVSSRGVASTSSGGRTSSLASHILPEADLEQLSESIRQLSSAAQRLSAIGASSSEMLQSYEAIAKDYNSINDGTQKYLSGVEDLARNVSGLNTIYEIQLKSISSQIDAIDQINTGLHRISSMYSSSVVDSESFRVENERLSKQLNQLNQVYARMLEAMTVNMSNPMNSSEKVNL